MEGSNTVDVSWLHHSHRADQLLRTKAATSSVHEKTNGAADSKPERSGLNKETSQRLPDELPQSTRASQPKTNGTHTEQPPSNTRSAPEKKAAVNPPATPVKGSAPKAVPGRRNSWISSISSKFSTGTTPPGQGAAPQVAPKLSPPVKPDINPFGASFSPKDKDAVIGESPNAFTSTTSSPKNPSFLQNAFRKFSSSGGGMG
ncbi:hypothetical protein F66182_12253, partial [Fusarium sp. NRRL 66182]